MQYFDKSIIDVIKSRHSVRTYYPESLTKELKQKLSDYAVEIHGPFDSKVRLELIDTLDAAEKTGSKIGTYGVIRGAQSYIAGVTDKKAHNMEQLGYCLEKLILYAASLDLGTCWLGGTFKKSQFAELAGLKEEEMLPIVTPIGYPADRRALVDSIMRSLAGSDNRKHWKELFFEESFGNPLSPEMAGEYQACLEMVRLAPSASNKQPWRILKQGNELHFYLKHTKGYSNALGYDIQKIDMGIAMCHFEMTLTESGVIGKWKINESKLKMEKAEELEYITSWISE